MKMTEITSGELHAHVARQLEPKLPMGWADAPDLLTPAEVAALLRISRSGCYESLRAGDLKPLAIRWGRKILVSKGALRTLLDESAGR